MGFLLLEFKRKTPQKYLIFDFSRGNQTFLEYGRKALNRLGDYYDPSDTLSESKVWIIQCIFGHLVAQGINATLITIGQTDFEPGLMSGNWQYAKYTRMIPGVPIFDDSKYTVEHIWNDMKDNPMFTASGNQLCVLFCPKTKMGFQLGLFIVHMSF